MRNKTVSLVAFMLLAVAPGLTVHADGPADAETGSASFYQDSLHGNLTANGETYDRNAMTAAHPTLPFGTRIRVTKLRTGDAVEVRINDRGPFVEGRIVDLSRKAAQELGIVEQGIARVALEVL